MSAVDRQNRLLLAEDWKRVYQTFRNADFQSYDFENLRRTMIDYLRENYPEDFNDYIESSEYLALIDLIAFLGQSIAFRVDLNARENFLELAERRESVLRTARMLSYNSKRNMPAQGLLKFNTVQTSQNVIDSDGRNLSGQVITWNDSSNSNWRDQFLRVLNAAMDSNQQFGNPSDKDTIYGISTEQYRFTGANTDVPIYSFSKSVSSRSMTFEITSTTFKDKNYIYEETPKVRNSLACIYRDDNRGPGSPNTGFFLNFVQGILNTGTFTVTQPSNNESIDIDSQNINNNDVWLYKVDQNGVEIEEWAKVPSLEGNNVIYNSLNKKIRNIFGVVTRAGDAVSLVFSDGTFGNLPLGTFRVYYRVSNGLSYTINPQDIRSVSITVPYTSGKGQPETLSISMNLASSVVNASVSETNDSIKTNAPAAYYTQNRMITGEDYNISPLTVNQQVAKIKAVNRTSSGISRYFDLIDPTGKYSSTNLFGTDGILYQENFASTTKFSYVEDADIYSAIYNKVFDVLDGAGLKHYYYSKYLVLVNQNNSVPTPYWNTVDSANGISNGYVIDNVFGDSHIVPVGSSNSTNLKYFTPGALIKFIPPANHYFNTRLDNSLIETSTPSAGQVLYLWAEVVSVISDGLGQNIDGEYTGAIESGDGAITLNKQVPTGAIISTIIPKWKTTLSQSTIVSMVDLIKANAPFGLRYDSLNQRWVIILESNLDLSGDFSLVNAGNMSNTRKDASWLVLFSTDNENYLVQSRELRYVFESDQEVEFYFDRSNKIYDSKTNQVVKDLVTVLSINQHTNTLSPFTQDFIWDIVSGFTGLDGYYDGKKVIVSFADADDNGGVDDPSAFLQVVNPYSLSLQDRYIIEKKYTISEGQDDYRFVKNTYVAKGKLYPANKYKLIEIYETQPLSIDADFPDGQYFYFVDTDTVKKLNVTRDRFLASRDYKVYIGRSDIKFQYTHSADSDARIDPGASNIIDIYVLTKSYDTAFKQWINGSLSTKPLPPSTTELHNTLSSLNLIKAVSDEIVYHPVSYKILFGSLASLELQAVFKVTKTAGRVVSDNDIKARVISAINQFFELENWDFGDTFYFTELSTYVMTQLAPDISNFVIVPQQSGLNFGSLFEIKSDSDQLFVNGCTVNDIEIISGITMSNIKSVSNTTVDSTILRRQYIASSSYGDN
jgi:hypothetical protein